MIAITRVARRDGLLDSGDQVVGGPRRYGHGHALDHKRLAPGAELPALVVRGMIVVGDHDFIARLEVDSPDDQIGALAGVSGDGDLFG